MLGAASPTSAPELYGFTLGLVAALNPCGFPLLPAYLTLFVDRSAPAGLAHRTARALQVGAAVTAGFVVVFGILGGVVESGVQVLTLWLPWVMIPIGVLLAIGGILTILGRAPRLSVPMRGGRRRSGTWAAVGFGATYAVASLSCGLPLFLAGVAGTFTRLGVLHGVMVALAYALGMGLFLMAASLTMAWVGAPALGRVRPLSRFVPRVGGAVLTVVGMYLVYYWATDLLDPTLTPGPVRVVEAARSAVSGWMAGSVRLVGALLGLVVVLACTVAALHDHRGNGEPPPVPWRPASETGSGPIPPEGAGPDVTPGVYPTVVTWRDANQGGQPADRWARPDPTALVADGRTLP